MRSYIGILTNKHLLNKLVFFIKQTLQKRKFYVKMKNRLTNTKRKKKKEAPLIGVLNNDQFADNYNYV